MARLAAKAKGLYYPTPLRVVYALAEHIQLDETTLAPGNVIRLLDPCCGTGSAALFFARLLHHRYRDKLAFNTFEENKASLLVYGIELDKERAKHAKHSYYQVLSTNALSAMVDDKSFDIIFANPPYDSTDEPEKRLESQFTQKFGLKVRPGGIYINIVPRTIMDYINNFTANYFENIHVYKFPDPEYLQFKQLVVIGVRRKEWKLNKKLAEDLGRIKLFDNSITYIDYPSQKETIRLIREFNLPLTPDVEKELNQDDDDDDESDVF